MNVLNSLLNVKPLSRRPGRPAARGSTRRYRCGLADLRLFKPVQDRALPLIHNVASLTGWPIGWTALKPLGMDKFQSWLQQHSGFWLDRDIGANPHAHFQAKAKYPAKHTIHSPKKTGCGTDPKNCGTDPQIAGNKKPRRP